MDDKPHLVPCRHLDYDEDKFGDACTLKTAEPHFPQVRYWERGPQLTDGGVLPVNVQFCKLRGRINAIFDCYERGCMHCYDPKTQTDDASEDGHVVHA